MNSNCRGKSGYTGMAEAMKGLKIFGSQPGLE